MTTFIATLNHVPTPFVSVVARIARGFRIFFEALEDARAMDRAARKRYPYLAW